MNEVVIVGGGLAGAAAAIVLARAGRDVTLIEKEAAPHDKVCGEFLSHEALLYLDYLGMDLPVLGAVAIDRVRFETRARKLPFMARSLSRRALDEALLIEAENAGAKVLCGQKVEEIESNDDGWNLRLNSSLPSGIEAIGATSVFLASGKHDVRGLKRPPGRQNDLVGFKMHFCLAASQQRDLEGAVELFLFPGGYGGLEPVENGHANLCFLIRRSMLERLNGWYGALHHIRTASPLIAQRLEGAEALWEKPLAISAIPYGYVRQTSAEGLWRLGDQAAVIPSFSGDGMSIALHSGLAAATTYLAGGTAAQYQQRLAKDVSRQVAFATMISRVLINPFGQQACRIVAGLMPGLIGITANATRIPHSAVTV